MNSHKSCTQGSPRGSPQGIPPRGSPRGSPQGIPPPKGPPRGSPQGVPQGDPPPRGSSQGIPPGGPPGDPPPAGPPGDPRCAPPMLRFIRCNWRLKFLSMSELYALATAVGDVSISSPNLAELAAAVTGRRDLQKFAAESRTKKLIKKESIETEGRNVYLVSIFVGISSSSSTSLLSASLSSQIFFSVTITS